VSPFYTKVKRYRWYGLYPYIYRVIITFIIYNAIVSSDDEKRRVQIADRPCIERSSCQHDCNSSNNNFSPVGLKQRRRVHFKRQGSV